MNAILAALAGAMITAGILGIIWGLRPAPEPVPKPPARRSLTLARRWRAIPPVRRWAALAGLAAGIVAGALTGWLVLIVLLPAAVLGLPLLLATSTETERIARLDGIAEWTRNLSGVLTAGQGLEQALIASFRGVARGVRRAFATGLSALVLTVVGVGLSATPAHAVDQSTATCTKSGYGLALASGIPMHVPETSSGSENCLLSASQYGSGATKALQTAMNKCYGESLTVDGAFGSKTTAALKRTQTKIGVTSDGIYGVKTHNKMKFYEDDTADGGPYCAKVEAL